MKTRQENQTGHFATTNRRTTERTHPYPPTLTTGDEGRPGCGCRGKTNPMTLLCIQWRGLLAGTTRIKYLLSSVLQNFLVRNFNFYDSGFRWQMQHCSTLSNMTLPFSKHVRVLVETNSKMKYTDIPTKTRTLRRQIRSTAAFGLTGSFSQRRGYSTKLSRIRK